MQGLPLFYREMGEGPALIIIHGLYGSSDNWMSVAKKLAAHFHVYLIDQRNHGQSPHSDTHDYQAMCSDLERFFRDHDIVRPVLLGHSMGGKTAMFFAASHPEEISALIVVDISPRTYVIRENQEARFSGHKLILKALLELDLQKLTTREEAFEALATRIPEPRVRHFLLKNLDRDEDNRFSWKLNLPVIYDNLANILQGLDHDPSIGNRTFTGFPVLFIRGGASTYIQESDEILIDKIFSFAEIVTIPHAGHWVHAEQPESFVRTVLTFLLE